MNKAIRLAVILIWYVGVGYVAWDAISDETDIPRILILGIFGGLATCCAPIIGAWVYQRNETLNARAQRETSRT